MLTFAIQPTESLLDHIHAPSVPSLPKILQHLLDALSPISSSSLQFTLESSLSPLSSLLNRTPVLLYWRAVPREVVPHTARRRSLYLPPAHSPDSLFSATLPFSIATANEQPIADHQSFGVRLLQLSEIGEESAAVNVKFQSRPPGGGVSTVIRGLQDTLLPAAQLTTETHLKTPSGC